jgi:hypothetical protein
MEFWKAIGKGLWWIFVGICIIVALTLFLWLAGWILSIAWNNSVAVIFNWKQIDTNIGIWLMILLLYFKPSITYNKKK